MKHNRAKCKKCDCIIESFHTYDHVACKCGEIEVWGGNAMYCSAKDWNNFYRVDDLGNEIKVTVIDPENEKSTRIMGAIDTLKNLKNTLENLPEAALLTPVTHADHLSLLALLCDILELD